MNHKFENEVRKLFSSVSEYSENVGRKSVTFRVDNGFNAESLFKLSDLLGTSQILSTPETEYEWAGCPTCGDDLTSYISVYASEVVF